jgi:hypothetical protein
MRSRSLVSIALMLTLAGVVDAQERPRIPQGPSGTVTLPVADYDRLVDRATLPEKRPDPPPVASVVSRAELRARVDGDTARGTLRLDGETFVGGFVKVPLVAGATLLEGRATGAPLPLVQEGDVHAAVLAGPSPFSITLDWAARLASAPGRASFALPAPSAGTTVATLDLPGDPADVRVEPGIVARRQAAGGRTLLDVTLEPGRRAQVSWSIREAAGPAKPVEARTLADVKSLLTIRDADLRLTAIVDITVVRGEPRTFEVGLPADFELTTVTGPSVDSHAVRDGVVTLTVLDSSSQRHQFLVTLERSRSDGSFKTEAILPTVPGAQREVGEVAIEAIGTVEVDASGGDGLRRMDVRETHAALRSLASRPLLAAFRYQRRQAETRTLTLDVKRFADAPVIAAVAEHGTATTLVTTEGRMLTEVQLTLRNRAQPFMKVTLPPGATMLSAEVAGAPAKPVTASDGTRVPLLRAGFRPDGAYVVSFVYLQAGAAFEKRGEARMALPSLDVPISVLEWELFLPDRFSAKASGGNVIPAHLLGMSEETVLFDARSSGHAVESVPSRTIGTGQIVGRLTDSTGAVIPGASVTVRGAGGREQTIASDANGWYSLRQVPSGTVALRAELEGFRSIEHVFEFDQRPRQVDFRLEVAALTETVTVQSQSAKARDAVARAAEGAQAQGQTQAPSQNVMNLQRRVSGVLPVRIDVPRTGIAFQFARPLVVDEPTTVTFKYKRR